MASATGVPIFGATEPGNLRRFNAAVLARGVHGFEAKGDLKMIRIQTSDYQGGIMVAIEGQLAGEDIEEVETSVREVTRQDKGVHLFLRDVTHIDEKGHSLLSRMAASGVELSAAGLYSSYVVAQIQRVLGTRQSKGG